MAFDEIATLPSDHSWGARYWANGPRPKDGSPIIQDRVTFQGPLSSDRAIARADTPTRWLDPGRPNQPV